MIIQFFQHGSARIQVFTRYGQTISLQPVHLLRTRQPEQLAQIMRNRRLRDRVQEQISPRHALVSPDMQQPLRKWLAKQNILLDAPETHTSATAPPSLAPAAYARLGLQLLAALGDIVELPLTVPSAAFADTETTLDPDTLALIDRQTQTILAGIQDVIRGRDAFFPASQPPPTSWFADIEQALVADLPLSIAYQTLADTTPRTRTIQPLRLEQRGELYCLFAYCYLAERNLTFRLDRIHALQITEVSTLLGHQNTVQTFQHNSVTTSHLISQDSLPD